MLAHRLVVGSVLLAGLIGLLWADQSLDQRPIHESLRPYLLGRAHLPPGMVIFPVVVLISVQAGRELSRILRDNGIEASTGLTCAAAIVGLAVSCLVPSDTSALHAVALVSSAAVLVLLSSLGFYARRQAFEGIVAAAGGTLLAFVYLGLMFGFLLAIRREQSAWVLLGVILVTKSGDIGAYFTGRVVGRHKMIHWLSPGKTWEGLVGGVALASLAGSIGMEVLTDATGRAALPVELPAALVGALAGGLFALVGQGGDLIASLFKRDAGLKDSGQSLPGFGGFLDVIDSPLLVAPVAYWMVTAWWPGPAAGA